MVEGVTDIESCGPSTFHTAGNPLTVRPLTEADRDDAIRLDGIAFLGSTPADFLAEFVRPTLEIDRYTGVFDGAELVGVAGIFTKDVTFPGGRQVPFAGVTWVGVKPGYTGRGILRSLMTDQLHGLHTRGQEPIAMLTASESGIYGRFGYGMATRNASFDVPSGIAFKVEPPRGTVKQVPREVAMPHLKAIHARVAASTPGYLSRPEVIWNQLYSDHEVYRSGRSTLEFVVHADGFLAFRTKGNFDERGPRGELLVHELCAATPEARAALWRHVLDYSLVREISYPRGSVDEMLQDLVVDPRALKTATRDHLWLRIVDLDRTVPLRSYSADADVVVRVIDRFCPWNDGVWHLTLGSDGGTATPSTETPEVALDIVDLAATFLGDIRLARFAAAGRVTGDPAAIAALDLALSTPLAPWSPEGF